MKPTRKGNKLDVSSNRKQVTNEKRGKTSHQREGRGNKLQVSSTRKTRDQWQARENTLQASSPRKDVTSDKRGREDI